MNRMTWKEFRAGKKQNEIAQLLGVSESYISRIERGNRRLSGALRWRLFTQHGIVIEEEPCIANDAPSVEK